MNRITQERRALFQQFVQQMLQADTAVKGVIGIGSMAAGSMCPDSSAEAVVFLHPFDYFVIPAEAIWDPLTHRFHSIFSEDSFLRENGLKLDLLRLDWAQWAAPEFVWPEGHRAAFSTGWLVYDRDGDLAPLIAQKTTYPADVRLARLDAALVTLDQFLGAGKVEQVWQTQETAVAHDHLEAAYASLVEALFAINYRWRPWRQHEMSALLQLPWLPAQFAARVLIAANAPSLDYVGYQARAAALRELFGELLAQLVANGDYSYAPIDQAFMRLHNEPGRSWNIEEWHKLHLVRYLSLTGAEEAPLV